jgi:hypothetical protein
MAHVRPSSLAHALGQRIARPVPLLPAQTYCRNATSGGPAVRPHANTRIFCMYRKEWIKKNPHVKRVRPKFTPDGPGRAPEVARAAPKPL